MGWSLICTPHKEGLETTVFLNGCSDSYSDCSGSDCSGCSGSDCSGSDCSGSDYSDFGFCFENCFAFLSNSFFKITHTVCANPKAFMQNRSDQLSLFMIGIFSL